MCIISRNNFSYRRTCCTYTCRTLTHICPRKQTQQFFCKYIYSFCIHLSLILVTIRKSAHPIVQFQHLSIFFEMVFFTVTHFQLYFIVETVNCYILGEFGRKSHFTRIRWDICWGIQQFLVHPTHSKAIKILKEYVQGCHGHGFESRHSAQYWKQQETNINKIVLKNFLIFLLQVSQYLLQNLFH